MNRQEDDKNDQEKEREIMVNQEERTAEAQHEVIESRSGHKMLSPNPHPDAQWFLKGGNLGMFIHWGIAAADGNIELSWSMYAGKPWDREGYKNTVTPDYYFSLAEKFAPDGCDFDRMLSKAAECGNTYAVLTTRHHEGFALWPSDYGSFNTKKYHKGADFVQKFVDSCHKNGLRVGLYYSPPDWYRNQRYMSFHYQSRSEEFPDRPHYDINHHPINELPQKPADWELEEAEYVRNQVRELLTRYGKIDILWFDGSIPLYDKSITIDEIRRLQPSIVMTPRMHGMGDYMEYELSFPESKPDFPWEYGTTWTEFNWGYCEQCLHTHRSARWALNLYKQVREWDGNLLLNVGPDNNCRLPDVSYKTLNELKALLREEGLI